MSYSESASKQRIRVAIGSTSGSMFWESLESYLRTVPDIVVIRITADRPLEDAVGERCPHVLLLELFICVEK